MIKKATETNKNLLEAVRVLDDAFRAVEDVAFMGQETKPFYSKNKKDDLRNNSFHMLPVKLRFLDHESRIFF